MITIMDISQVGGAPPIPDAPDAMKDVRMVMQQIHLDFRVLAWRQRAHQVSTGSESRWHDMPTNLFGGQTAPDPLAQAAAGAEGSPRFSAD